MWKSILAVALGSIAGGLLRWGLGAKLDDVSHLMPAGTLAANLIASYVIGLAMAYLIQSPSVTPEWRLFIVTGFCGGLSTFSSFSSEVVSLLQQGRLVWALTTVGAHVGGSLIMTILGVGTLKFIH